MSDRPIIFSAPMVRALLDGRKTMTRRVLKPQPPTFEQFPGSVFGLCPSVADGVKMYSQNDYERLPKHPTRWDLVGSVGVARDAGFPNTYNARFAHGDRLYVRERAHIDGTQVSYAADCDPRRDLSGLGYRPSIHMPRWASRLTLIVESVKVERLQDISEEDAIAEGCGLSETQFALNDDLSQRQKPVHGDGWFLKSARGNFIETWCGINGGIDAWEANPWVAAISFRVIKANIDSAGGAP